MKKLVEAGIAIGLSIAAANLLRVKGKNYYKLPILSARKSTKWINIK